MPCPVPLRYEQVITSLGSVIEAYDHDNRYPVYGFGGVKKNTRGASHCFPLTGDPGNAEVRVSDWSMARGAAVPGCSRPAREVSGARDSGLPS
jgi:hypothetical protein